MALTYITNGKIVLPGEVVSGKILAFDRQSGKIIGVVDDPRFFASPERFGAEILWFGHGYVEYMLPCYLQENQELIEFHRYLVNIRKKNPAFRNGSFKPLLAEAGIIAYGRFDKENHGVSIFADWKPTD